MEQPLLSGIAVEPRGGDVYGHAVLVTNWRESDLRAGAENLFDELKNQWGWTGFSTEDLKRSQLMARIVALIYNWWSIFTRMGTGARHGEALMTRPLFQQAVVRRTRHANQTKLSILSIHAKARQAAQLLDRISECLCQLVQPAEQLAQFLRWREMLVRIFAEFGQFPLGEK